MTSRFQKVKVRASSAASSGGGGKDKPVEFEALVRIDTPQEALYYSNGGILQYVLRQLLAGKPSAEAPAVDPAWGAKVQAGDRIVAVDDSSLLAHYTSTETVFSTPSSALP